MAGTAGCHVRGTCCIVGDKSTSPVGICAAYGEDQKRILVNPCTVGNFHVGREGDTCLAVFARRRHVVVLKQENRRVSGYARLLRRVPEFHDFLYVLHVCQSVSGIIDYGVLRKPVIAVCVPEHISVRGEFPAAESEYCGIGMNSATLSTVMPAKKARAMLVKG